MVVDVFGNEVDGQTVLWSVTNGTFSSTGGMAETTSTPNAQVVYLPHLTGTQTITVSWGSNSVDIPVVVTVGAPHHLVISGCEIVCFAGEICVYSWTVEDIRDNPMPALQAGMYLGQLTMETYQLRAISPQIALGIGQLPQVVAWVYLVVSMLR